MLSKLTRSNQVTIPRDIVKRAGLHMGQDYLDVEYKGGIILLRPVTVEEKIPKEVFEKFQKSVLKAEKGDVSAGARKAARILFKRAKK